MRITEKKCKSIISDSNIYGVDYSMNPYTGCEHGCTYCYATFMKEYSNHSEDWGDFVDVKINAREVLENDLMKRKKGSILLSSVTDAYQRIEEKYRITREILKRLANTAFSINILTKSDLVKRDLDVIKKFHPDRIYVGFTINFLEDVDRKAWEPKSSRITDRLNALKSISEEGINTYIHVGPYLTGITDIWGIANEIEEHADEIQIENMNLNQGRGEIMKTIKMNYPDLIPIYEDIMRDDTLYKIELERNAERLSRETNLTVRLFMD